MSYVKRTPCQKYYDKSNKNDLHKSLSATRFVPFRRSSDTTSDSGSDDFKIEPPEEMSSSFSRSSSESCHSYMGNNRYHCIIKDLNEINQDHDQETDPNLVSNESLSDFRSRLASRRKIKTREVFASQDDSNSCDSTTTKAHEEILRSASMLKQEQIETNDDYASKKAAFHKDIQQQTTFSSNNKRFVKAESAKYSCKQEETTLLKQFDKILQIPTDTDEQADTDDNTTQPGPSTSSKSLIARSSTETFFGKSNPIKTTQKPMSSPRFRPKTQVLKAASSIPSLIFSNKNSRLQKSTNNTTSTTIATTLTTNTNNSQTGSYTTYEQQNNKLVNGIEKKNSLDDDYFTLGNNKTRRSPLRFLGNLVDDKLFRGRWSSTKRAKSTDEITWALANEDLMGNDVRMIKESSRNRKKSLGLMSINSSSSNNTNEESSEKRLRFKSGGTEKSKTMSDFLTKKLFDDSYDSKKKEHSQSPVLQQKFADMKKRKTSSTSMPGSSITSLNLGDGSYRHNQSPNGLSTNEIRAETLAEIEAFEELLMNHLQS